MRTAITYATLINVVAIVPVLFLEGLSGSFFQPLALSYGLAVLASMFVACTVTPALCLLLLRRDPPRERESPFLRVLTRGYGAVLARVIGRPAPALLTAACACSPGSLVFPPSGSRCCPTSRSGTSSCTG